VKPAHSVKRRDPTNVALHYLARRDRTEHEVREHLRKYGFSEEAVSEALKKIRHWGYLDDGRVALRWAEYRIERYHWGPERVAQGCRQRGIKPALVEEIVREVMRDQSEEVLARRAADQYVRSHPGIEGARGMRRLVGYLDRRGYRGEVIYTVVGEHFEPSKRDVRDDGARD
jgi:regulatory protein